MSDVSDMGLSLRRSRRQSWTRRPQVLVAAAAGSGKTRLLVASVVRALVEERLPVERLVAVTFTRKAGAELASRVRAGAGGVRPARPGALAGFGGAGHHRLTLPPGGQRPGTRRGGRPQRARCWRLRPRSWSRRRSSARPGRRLCERADEAALEVFASQGKNLCKDVVALYDRLRGSGQDEPQHRQPAAAPRSRHESGWWTAIARALDGGLGSSEAVGLACGRPDQAEGLPRLAAGSGGGAGRRRRAARQRGLLSQPAHACPWRSTSSLCASALTRTGARWPRR